MKIKLLKSLNVFKISFLLFILSLCLKIGRALAQDNAAQSTNNFKETANNIVNNVLTSAGTLLMTAAFILFFYGVVMFIYGRVTNKGDLKELEKGKQFMLWGLIALFVMVSAWGIIKLAQDIFDIKGNNITIQPVQFAPLASTPKPPGGGDTDSIVPLQGLGGSCNTNSECQNGLQCSNKTCVKKSVNNPLQSGSDGVIRENPFANTDIFPLIKPGYNNEIFLAKLVTGLKNKKCTQATYNNEVYILNSSFGSVYEGADLEFVKLFQKVNGLSADGIVGKDTWEALSVTTGMKTTFTGIIVKDCK